MWWAALAACVLPAAALCWFAWNDDLGADPVARGVRYLGEWGLRFLVIGLALTPLRLATGWSWPARYRRMAGVAAFAYVSLHLLAYVGVDRFFDWGTVVADVLKRPYMTVGFLAFLILVPLAATSTDRMARRLGGRRWKALHRFAWLAAPLGALHYAMSVKADETWPLFYASLAAALLLARLFPKRGGGGRPSRAGMPSAATGPGRQATRKGCRPS